MDLHQVICLIFLTGLGFARGQVFGCRQNHWQCDDGNCIPVVWRCDGEGDCLDGSDEMDCAVFPGAPDCPSGQFPCVDSVGCVNASARCDGQRQCPTGFDEENCTAVSGCLDSDWSCRNHICIPKELRCNGLNDCMDSSDEDDCDVCDAGHIRCPDGTCLFAKEKCDGQIHCSDGSDEPITCGRMCSMNNGGCSHYCTDESWGALCTCPVGYKLSPNGVLCEDLNECATPFPHCMHYCSNTMGSYYCHCREGFTLNGSSTCLATGNATRLLTVQRGAMGLLNVKSQQFEVVHTPVFDLVALMFDIARGWYFWADSHGSIYKSDGQYSGTIFTGEPGIKSLACDWLNGNLYWTNQKTQAIYMQAPDEDSYTTVLSKHIKPTDVVLIPVESLMFWINEGQGDRVTIEKSWMDGKERSSLTVLTAQSAHSLTADTATRRLFWISDVKKSIETVKVDGTGRYSFTGLFNRLPALGLAVFEDSFYWVDDKGLWQASQSQPNRKLLLGKAKMPLLTVYHELQQPQDSSACVKTPCQLCQLTKSNPFGFTCACPDSKILLLDGTCEYPRFIYGTSTDVNLLEFRIKESTKTQLFSNTGILSFDLDWYRDWLYWTNHTGHIHRTSLTQLKTEVVPTRLTVCFIKVDQRSGNLYWVSCEYNSIGTTTADGRYLQQLYHTEGVIQDFYVDWLRGGIHWLEEQRILSMSMMGGPVIELLHLAGGVRGNIAFDLRANSLLWNSNRAGLTTLSLIQDRSHQAGRRWNISGSVIAAFEPFLLSLADDVMTLWDRRDGSRIQDMTVTGHVVNVIAALRDIDSVPVPAATPEPSLFVSASSCITPSVLCPGSLLCISQKQLCDGQRDCPDGFDENDCVFRCNNPGDFLCSDRRKCVSRMEVCDGRAHCPDGSDEWQCHSANPTSALSVNVVNARSAPMTCRRGFKPCKDGLECVIYSHVCDGEEDCQDGSDEEECVAHCKAGEFLCFHGNRCIPPEQICDGQYDCQDQSDEMDCSKLSEGCHQRCDNNTRCIPETFLCDGERDCADGSDEEKCGLVACVSNQYRCASGQCVSEALRCDGYADCSDHSDEMHCTRPPRCPAQLRCPNSHECLQKEWLCDGEDDCEDGSDEKNCVTQTAKCREYQWQCGDSSQCIPVPWRCDGKEDCHNGVDEDKCQQRKCPIHLYQCGSGECVEPTLVCNGFTNCADSSDEGEGCTKRNCSSWSGPQCDHHCVSTPDGPRCYCAAGFRLQSNAVPCVDIDECSTPSYAVCKHTCLNTHGSYICHCHPGFYLEPDNKSCKTKDEPLLLASVQTELLLLGVHSNTLVLLSSASRPVFSLDYHWAQQRVYWLSPDYQSIRWVDVKDSNKKGTLIKGVKSDFIAVDWVGKNLYWVDGLVGQILAVKLSDTTVRSQDYTVVLGQDLEQPSSLVLLPHKGLMLWSEIGSSPQIERSGMDGSKRKVVVSRGLSWPVSLAYDFLDNRVYWADEKLRCIGSASLDGDDVKILQLAETPSPFSVAVFNDRVFWSDTKRRTIRSAEKSTGKDQKVLLKRPGQPFGLKVMHPLSQPAISNPCDKLHCSHLCLLAPAVRVQSGAQGSSRASVVRALTAVCRCPKGLLLSKDKITCSLPVESTFILLLSPATVYQIYLRSMHMDGVDLKKMPNSRDLALPGVIEATALDVSIQKLSIYVADAKRGSVEVLKLSSSRSRQGLTPAGQILQLKDDSVTALAVDWVTSNLYWSSTQRPDLHVTSHYGGYTTSLLQGSLKGTTSIALHPLLGLLCYTAIVVAGGKSQAEVSCAWMDGRNKAVLWRKSSIPTSLVFFNKGTVLYWADTGEGVISSIGVDGSGYKQYKTGPGLLISFTHTENILLWVTLDKDVTKVWFSDGLQSKQLWFETKTNIVEVKAYSEDSQSGSNSCSINNGRCLHLCLPYPQGRTCTCGRGFYSVNATSCAPLPTCPAGKQSCFDGSKCIISSKFCDGQVDCLDESDEQECPNTNLPSSRTKVSDGRHRQFFSTPNSKVQKNSVFSLGKEGTSCDLQHCSGHGNCITEGKVHRCQCNAGYKGEFCQDTETRHGHVSVILGIFCLIAILMGAAFIFAKSRFWESFGSRSMEKETLMSNMGLPYEHNDSDSEELESPVDVKNPPLTLTSLQLQ